MSDDVTGWLGAMVALAGLAVGLQQYRVNSFGAARSRCREQPIKAADELEALVTDADVETAFRLIDYGGGTLPTPDAQPAAMVDVNEFILINALDHHGDRAARGTPQSCEKGMFTPVELQIRRIFDRFLTRLERVENLIRKDVIAQCDFEDLFSYWLELVGKRPKPMDRIAHVSDEFRGQLWGYVRYYRFDGVVWLFQRFGRAGLVGAAAFVARTVPPSSCGPRLPSHHGTRVGRPFPFDKQGVSIMRAAFVAVALLASAPPVLAQSCGVGPDYCLNDPRYPKLLAEKKARLAKDYPAELVALLDRDGHCVAALRLGQEGFSILTARAGGKLIIAWDEDNERISRQQVIDGEARAYYKFNVARRLACEGETPAEQRPDWDPALEINTGLSIVCKKAGGDVACR